MAEQRLPIPTPRTQQQLQHPPGKKPSGKCIPCLRRSCEYRLRCRLSTKLLLDGVGDSAVVVTAGHSVGYRQLLPAQRCYTGASIA